MKAVLLDAYGVVFKKGEYFSERYAREYGVPNEEVMEFFKGPFGDCQAGTKDLKRELAPYLEKWGWQGSVDDFLNYWFEDVQVDPSIEEVLRECRERGIKCYLASNNEEYRARRIEEVLGNKLDGYFFSADLKVKKNNPEYFSLVLEKLNLSPEEVGFVDNDGENIEAAKEIGIQARLYKEGVVSDLLNEGVVSEFKNKLQ